MGEPWPPPATEPQPSGWDASTRDHQAAGWILLPPHLSLSLCTVPPGHVPTVCRNDAVPGSNRIACSRAHLNPLIP